MDGWMGGCMDGWVGGSIGGWVDEWMDGWVGGWVFYSCVISSTVRSRSLYRAANLT